MNHEEYPHRKPDHRQKTTGRTDNAIPPVIIILIVLIGGFVFLLPSVIMLIHLIATPSFSGMSNLLKSGFIIVLISIITILIAIPIGYAIGKLRARHKLFRDDHHVQRTNPYQYYKELPNNFGIGVASLLNNSTIENEKDIVAAILDLCAQGYLRLSKHSDHYVIRLASSVPHTPLSNEAYLLQLIRNNAITNIDYQKWYQLCVNDGVQLGLFRPFKFPANEPEYIAKHQKSIKRWHIGKVIASTIGATIFVVVAVSILLIKNASPNFSTEELTNIIGIIFIVAISIFVCISVAQAIFIAWLSLRSTSRISYKVMLERHLERTDQGVIELQKLYSFKAFLAQFNTFVDKDPEAVILWERYLSYAQVFGLAREIMRSGYSQLIDNVAFKIDDINNITLSNISLSE